MNILSLKLDFNRRPGFLGCAACLMLLPSTRFYERACEGASRTGWTLPVGAFERYCMHGYTEPFDRLNQRQLAELETFGAQCEHLRCHVTVIGVEIGCFSLNTLIRVLVVHIQPRFSTISSPSRFLAAAASHPTSRVARCMSYSLCRHAEEPSQAIQNDINICQLINLSQSRFTQQQ